MSIINLKIFLSYAQLREYLSILIENNLLNILTELRPIKLQKKD